MQQRFVTFRYGWTSALFGAATLKITAYYSQDGYKPHIEGFDAEVIDADLECLKGANLESVFDAYDCGEEMAEVFEIAYDRARIELIDDAAVKADHLYDMAKDLGLAR